MTSPAFSVAGVIDALASQPAKIKGGGRAILLTAARRREGVTTAACAVAQALGPGAVYALDLDLRRNALAKALSETAPLGPRIDGELGGVRFYDMRAADGAPLRLPRAPFGYHRVGRSRLFAGVFDARLAPARARVAISSQPEYWNAARAGGAHVVIDAPALERSDIALRVARHMDGVVLVVGAEPGAAPAALAAKRSLAAAGANLIGLIYAGAAEPVMAIDRWLGQAARASASP